MPFGARHSTSLIKPAARGLIAAVLLATPLVVSSTTVWALSEIKREEIPPPGQAPSTDDKPTTPPAATQPETQVPMPDPMSPAAPSTDEAPEQKPDEGQDALPGVNPDVTPDEEGGIARPDVDPNAPPPQVEYDVEKLPEPVRRMRNLLVEACKSGDIEKLRPLVGTGDRTPQLSLSETPEDPVSFLKAASGDGEGREILAIMEEVLDAGYVHLNAGTPEEIYVWPYFFGLSLDKLDPRQRVELYKIITAGDYDEMVTFNTYIFYRLGITPAGEWAFFVTGE
jgi:hypothetical protein